MFMTEREICSSYKNAERQSIQVRILSELNACSKEIIEEILTRNGIEIWRPISRAERKRRKEAKNKKER